MEAETVRVNGPSVIVEKILCQNSMLEMKCRLFYPRQIKGTPGLPLGLENLEKKGEAFPFRESQEILNRLEKSGKITQNTGKLREFEINII